MLIQTIGAYMHYTGFHLADCNLKTAASWLLINLMQAPQLVLTTIERLTKIQARLTSNLSTQ